MKIITQQEKVSFVVMNKLLKCIASLTASLWVAISANLITQKNASVSLTNNVRPQCYNLETKRKEN
jgi:hypothetical protein